MKQEQFTTTIIEAEEGHYLTQSEEGNIENRIIATKVALGKNDSVDNWKEITQEEADAYMASMEEPTEE